MSKEAMPRIHAAGKGGNGDIWLQGRNKSRIKVLSQKFSQWGEAVAGAGIWWDSSSS